jgi:hypothetical protein
MILVCYIFGCSKETNYVGSNGYEIENKTIERAFLHYSDESVTDEDSPPFIYNAFGVGVGVGIIYFLRIESANAKQ